MTDNHDDINRRLGEIRDELHETRVSNEDHHDEMFTRLRTLEIAMATAKGAKAGVIFSFSFMWALALAGVAALVQWART